MSLDAVSPIFTRHFFFLQFTFLWETAARCTVKKDKFFCDVGAMIYKLRILDVIKAARTVPQERSTGLQDEAKAAC